MTYFLSKEMCQKHGNCDIEECIYYEIDTLPMYSCLKEEEDKNTLKMYASVAYVFVGFFAFMTLGGACIRQRQTACIEIFSARTKPLLSKDEIQVYREGADQISYNSTIESNNLPIESISSASIIQTQSSMHPL